MGGPEFGLRRQSILRNDALKLRFCGVRRTSPGRSFGRALSVGIDHRRSVPTSVKATLPLSLVEDRRFPFGRGGRLWAPVISRRPVPFS